MELTGHSPTEVGVAEKLLPSPRESDVSGNVQGLEKTPVESASMVREAIPGDLLSTSLPISPGRSDVLPTHVTTEPGVPDEPEVPVAPDVPDVPEVPVAPEVPDVPETPVAPDTPEEPELPEVAGEPVAQDGPVKLDIVSEGSGVKQLPDEPSIPGVPELMDELNITKSRLAPESADTESLAVLGALVMDKEVIDLSQLPEELRTTKALPLPNSSSLSIPNNDGVRVLSLDSDDLFVFTNRSVPEQQIASEDTLAPAAIPVPARESSRLTREDARILLFGAEYGHREGLENYWRIGDCDAAYCGVIRVLLGGGSENGVLCL
jgi:hypothetical protein